MRIGVFAGNAIPTGGGAYTLIESIKRDIRAASRGHEILFFFADRDAAEAETRDGFRCVNFAERRPWARTRERWARRLRLEVRERRLDEALKRERIDLLWILGPFELEVSIPYVFTVWDLGHRSRPAFPELDGGGWTWIQRERTYQKMLYKASCVITGNEAGKREILENYPMNPDKVRIVPFPVPDFCFAKAPSKPIEGLAEPFVFYPAQFWAHKNHIALVEAMRRIRDAAGERISCYFVGSDQGNKAFIEAKIAEYGLGDRVRCLGFVEEAELRHLYERALAMTFMSLLGPNNLPPLEAAALGCPVIISDLPGHLEEMEGAALAVDATDYDKVAEAILALARDPGLRADYIAKGRRLAESYRGYSYFDEVCKIVDDLAGILATWKR